MPPRITNVESPLLDDIPENWEITVIDPLPGRGLRLFQAKDPFTGVSVGILEFNREVDVATFSAWLAAMSSRNNSDFGESLQSIMEEFQKDPRYAAMKLAQVFVTYNHESVGDMVPVFVFFNHIPMHVAYRIFNWMRVGAGMETSSRYVRLDELGIIPPEKLLPLEHMEESPRQRVLELWEQLQTFSGERYGYWTDLIIAEFTQQFANAEFPNKKTTIRSRALDVSRMFLPAGTSEIAVAALTSIRTWRDIVKLMRESSNPQLIRLGEQLYSAITMVDQPGGEDLKLDANMFMKYSDPKFIIENNLNDLREYLITFPEFNSLVVNTSENHSPKGSITEVVQLVLRDYPYNQDGILMAMQYVLVLFPALREEDILHWLKNLNPTEKANISTIIIHGHDKHNRMAAMGDIRGVLYRLEIALAYARDLGRHRAFGVLDKMLETQDFGAILSAGFHLPVQFLEMPSLQPHREAYQRDMQQYYGMLWELFELVTRHLPGVDQSFILNLIPLGHQVSIHMSGPSSQFIYMSDQRRGKGTDAGYADAVMYMRDLAIVNDPFLALDGSEQFEDINAPEVFGSR